MLMGTLGPLAQQTPHRPLAVAASPSLLEYGRPAARQCLLALPLTVFEPPAVVERLRAVAAFRALVVHKSFMRELNFFIAGEPEIVQAPPTIEIRAREPRRPPSALAEERAVFPSRPESPMPEPDVRPFVMAVRGLIETERITAARHMLAAAPAYILGDPLVARLRSVLAPPVVRRMQKRDVDRTQEFDWLRAHGREYRGRWVALVGSNVLASTATLRELLEQLRTTDVSKPPLLHRVD